jgi:hypothetical protein
VCKGELIEKSNLLQCNRCAKQYPIINDIPVFLNEKTPYDNLYSQINFNKSPFGYNVEYSTWRKGQINREIVKYLKAGSVLDDGGGYGFLKEFLGEKSFDNVVSGDVLEHVQDKIIVQTRTDNHLFGFTHKFWRKFGDMLIDPKKFGHCVFFVCKKVAKIGEANEF